MVCCNVLQCVAVCCCVLQCVAVCCRMLHSVALCSGYIIAHKATLIYLYIYTMNTLQHPAPHCNTTYKSSMAINSLQHTAIHCNTLQHVATQVTSEDGYKLTATHCNTLQHTAIHCNTLQHVATQITSEDGYKLSSENTRWSAYWSQTNDYIILNKHEMEAAVRLSRYITLCGTLQHT